MVKNYEALGLLTTPVYVFTLPTHITAVLSAGLFITITLAALTWCYGLICTSVSDFCSRANTDFSAVTHPSDP